MQCTKCTYVEGSLWDWCSLECKRREELTKRGCPRCRGMLHESGNLPGFGPTLSCIPCESVWAVAQADDGDYKMRFVKHFYH
jgi:hypothetical protein